MVCLPTSLCCSSQPAVPTSAQPAVAANHYGWQTMSSELLGPPVLCLRHTVLSQKAVTASAWCLCKSMRSDPVSLSLTCSSLAFQKPVALARILATVKEAGITVVSLPLVNLWTQVNEGVQCGMNPDSSHTLAQLASQRAARRRTGRAM